MGKLGVFVLFVVLSPYLTGVLEAQREKLLFVHIISGHGDTTPLESYPNDPYKDFTFWDGLQNGELTKDGKRHQFELGTWLRQRYSGFVDRNFNNGEVYCKSIALDRCTESAFSVFKGLFPNGRSTNDVSATALDLDYLLNEGANCREYNYLYGSMLQSKDQKELLIKYSPTLEYLTENTGQQVKSLRDVQSIYNCLKIQEMNNLTLPSWTNLVYPNPMEEISALALQSLTGTREMAKLRSGFLLKEILKLYQDKMDETLDINLGVRKVWIYSVKDIQIVNFLNTLKMIDHPFNPPFNTLIMIELKVKEYQETPYISIFYKNGTSDERGQQMMIPDCGYECPLSKMKELYEDIISQHTWDEECNFNQKFDITNVLIYSIISVFVLITIFTVLKIFKKKPNTSREGYAKL